MLLDPTCVVCGASGAAVCSACATALRSAPSLPPPLGIDSWGALLRYDEVARAVLTGLKNRHRRDLVAWLADRLVTVLPHPGAAVVTWAPTGPRRRRARGYDQAELLARAVARRWHLPCRPALRRLPGPPQAGRAATARRVGPGFAVLPSFTGAPGPVLLVDDVATTGATLTAAARALRAAGVGEVRAVVVARALAPASARPGPAN